MEGRSLERLRNAIQRWARDRDVRAGFGVCLLIAAHVAYYFPRVVDDLFISLRYAENLARGNGAVYNIGERVEGYSSPAWMYIQTLGFILHLEPVTFTKVVGIACLFATAFGARELARRVYGVEGWASWIPAYACAATSYLVDWTVLGLETPFHVAAIVLCPIAIANALDARSPRHRALAVLAVVALGTSRPESALYVVANILAGLARARTRRELADTVKLLLPIVTASGVVLGGLLALRVAYYGELVPNTYFVKGAHASFALEKLAPLWRQGASPAEAIYYTAGIFVLLAYSIRRGMLAPALSVVLCLYFTAKVAPDWMPSLRHLLPVTVLAPVGWARIITDLREAKAHKQAAVSIGVVILALLSIASVDVRFSPIEHRSAWVERKSAGRWSDTLLAYRRIEPPHVTKMDAYAMGQISQVWGVLETSSEPVERSWYAGRDIGALGFYTGVRVFDTAGLVTREVSRSKAFHEGAAHGDVPDDLIEAMMAKHSVAADVFDGWDAALGRHPSLLAGYTVVSGAPDAPGRIVAADRMAPSHVEIVRRYRAFVARLPRLYHLHTLYGESMGAAAERRLRIVESTKVEGSKP